MHSLFNSSLPLSLIVGDPLANSDYHKPRENDRVVGMKDRELIVMFGAGIFVLFCLIIMVLLHEKHYRDRRVIIDPSLNIEDRLSNIERVLLEDRYT